MDPVIRKRPTIKMVPCQSSQVKEHGYDPLSSTLAVRFKTGGLYWYSNVPQEVAAGLHTAESKGAYIRDKIKAAEFSYERIDEERKDS